MERVVTLKALAKRHEDNEMLFHLADETVLFDRVLTERLKRYGFEPSVKAGVPEWMKLVGGTPEYFEIDATARVIVLEEIERFIDTFATKYHLV